MKLILGECLPRRLTQHLPDHEVSTVPGIGLAGASNGELLTAVADWFDVFITIDSNYQYQQKVSSYPIAVLVLRARSNRFADLLPLVPKILSTLAGAEAGYVYTVK